MERRFSRPRFGGRGYEDRFEKPVKNGETYDVEIKEVGSKGDGIARVNNFVIFVPNTQKGEKCKIKISQVNRTFAVAEKVSEATEVKEEPEEDLEEDIEEEVEEKKKEGDEGDYLED